MNSYSIGTFLKCLKGKITGYTTSGASGIFIMESIASIPTVSVTIEEKHISSLVNRNDNLNDNIVDGAKNPANRPDVLSYFSKKIVPKIITTLLHDACVAILDALKKDTTVPEANYNDFKNLYDKRKYNEFLTDTFIYACVRPNKEEHEIFEDDIPLLAETEYSCPICGKPLCIDVRGTSKKVYKILSIYDEAYCLPPGIPLPSNLDNNKNKIALCPFHHDEYFNHVDELRYKNMLDLKHRLERQKEARDIVSSIKLQRQIVDVVEAMKEDKNFVDFEFDSKTVTEIRNKITDPYLALEIETLVRQRYDQLLRLFNGMKSTKFEEIKAKIHDAFETYHKAGYNQEKIVDMLTAWILSNTGLSSDYKMASKVVLTFFIRICEVFYAIPK